MDIKDAKPTCGRVRSDNPARTCTLPAGHAGLHHWRPYPNASSGSTWDDSLAVSPHAERGAPPTHEEIKTLREDMAEIAKRKPLCLSPSKSWQPTYEDWVKERNDAVARADERDAYAKQVETLTKERDLARSKLDLCTGRLQTAIDEVAELRDLLAAEKQQVEEWRFTAVNRERVTAMATCAFLNAQQETELLRASLAATQAELERARQAADEWATTACEYERWRDEALKMVSELTAERGALAAQLAQEGETPTTSGLPCPHSKAKQVGSSSFVVRRCKLADGHDGMCEPA